MPVNIVSVVRFLRSDLPYWLIGAAGHYSILTWTCQFGRPPGHYFRMVTQNRAAATSWIDAMMVKAP